MEIPGLEDLPAPPKKEEHFTECYLRMYPDDPGVYCTCMDWSPEI